MRLAVIDPQDQILIAWPSTADAHKDLGELLAHAVHPGRFKRRRREKLARQVVDHVLELQKQTIRL